MQSIDERYLFSKFQSDVVRAYFIRSKDGSENIWISKATLDVVVSKYKVKILQLLHLNLSINISKHDVIQDLIQESKNYEFSFLFSNILTKRQQKIINLNLYHGSWIIFQKFRLSIITPALWKNSYRIIREPELFQVVGKKKYKGKTNSYLLKYKYFDEPKDYIWVVKTDFRDHPGIHALQKFDSENQQIELPFINKKYLKYQQILIQNIKSQPRRRSIKIIGKFKFMKYNIFYLFKNKNQSLQHSQWRKRRQYKSIQQTLLNRKIKKINLNVQNQPFIDQESIKKIILEEFKIKFKNKDENGQQVYLTDQMLNNLVQEKVMLFRQKLQKTKKEINNYFNKAFNIFEQESNQVNLSFLRQKLQRLKKQSQESSQRQQHHNKFQGQGQQKFQQQYEYEKNQYEDSPSEQNYHEQSEDQMIQKYQQSSQNQSDDQSECYDDDSQNIYLKTKTQCKEEPQENRYLFENDRKSSKRNIQNLMLENESKAHKKNKNFISKNKTQKIQDEIQISETYLFSNRSNKLQKKIQTKAGKIKLKIETIKLKSQRKNKIIDSNKDEETEVKKQEPSTSLQISSEQESHQSFCQSQQTKVQENPRVIIEISKIQHALIDECLYLIKFNDGKIVHGIFSEVIQIEGVNQELLKNAKQIFPTNKLKKTSA